MMNKLLLVGAGGFIGATLRYLVTLICNKIFGNMFPYGTLIVNVIGGLVIGFILFGSIDSLNLSTELKLFITTGILGGLTTFSTFSFETISIILQGKLLLGTINICANLFLSLGAVLIGKYLVKFI